jgi:PAS domain S-box-containing protein
MSVPQGAVVPGLHAAAGLEVDAELAQALIGALPQGVLVSAQDGRPLLANARAIEITGLAPEQLDVTAAPEGGRGGGATTTVWEQLVALGLDDAARDGRLIAGIARRADGSEFPFEASVNSLHAGQRQFLATFVDDVSARRAAERRLADARDAALRASVVKSEFLATMSHEIRIPMNGVIGSLDLMLDCALAPEVADLAQIARTAATDLLAIVDDILDLSKIEAGKVERRREEFELVAAVEGVADIVAVAARRKGIELTTYIDPAIARALHGDARLLRQVLVNLVGNAVNYTDRGEVVLRAELAAPLPDPRVRFSVRDTGAGIAPEAVQALFEPFTQADYASEERGGSGLGLAISSRLVDLMGGELSVESALGRGSTFSFELAFEAAAEPAPQHAPAPTGRPLHVLVIEALDSRAQAIEGYLGAWGMRAARALDAADGLERLAAAPAGERFDAVICAPPDPRGGRELATALRSAAGTDTVFLIELADIGEPREDDAAASSGFDAVVGKPVRQARLAQALAGAGSTPAAGAEAQRRTAGGELAGLRLLIAEDNPVNQEVLMRQVKRLGLLADAVANGQEVLDALARGSYDAVLMDCQMPVMDGYSAAQAIRSLELESGEHLPIIAVTANAMREDFERCMASGMDDFVAKPVTLAALSEAIGRSVSPRPAAAGEQGAQEGSKDGEVVAEDGEDALDRDALASLREDLGGGEALLRIIRLFLEQLDPQAEQIELEARTASLETLARNAHRMKSSAATLGARELAELLIALETAALAGDAAAVATLGERFSGAVAAARRAFEAVRDELEADADAPAP